MSRKRSSLTLPVDAFVDGGKPDPLSDNSRPDPEEGHRLIRAFLRIKEARLREALATLVEKLSSCQAQRPDIRAVRQIQQNVRIDRVIAERGLISTEAQAEQPNSDVHGRDRLLLRRALAHDIADDEAGRDGEKDRNPVARSARRAAGAREPRRPQ